MILKNELTSLFYLYNSIFFIYHRDLDIKHNEISKSNNDVCKSALAFQHSLERQKDKRKVNFQVGRYLINEIH